MIDFKSQNSESSYKKSNKHGDFQTANQSDTKSNNLSKEFKNILALFQNSLENKNLSFHAQEEKTREKVIAQIIENNSSSENKQRILAEFSGYGPLKSLLSDPDINEIIINGKDHIFYEKQGQMFLLEDSFLSQITFHNVVEKIGTKARITVNFKKPYCEGKWGSFRVLILCPPIVKKDFHLCLRKHPKQIWTLEKLKSLAPPFALDILRQFVKDKWNFLIAGPTSSGKTSVLNACLQEVAPFERILSIEDTDEIILPNKVSTKLLTQRDIESAHLLINQKDLVKQSLRLRPDRIVMGEVRGAEATDLLLALSTGHKGCIGTLHAKDHKQALWKLETLAQIGAPQWQSSTVQKLIFSSLNALVILDKKDDLRQLKGLYKITALESSGFLYETLFERNS
ncbi:MAG: ATPase, T2SS/T4P/T4SS family [Bdellovibrionaceae bacterium]|nr:ATPase, T2SS/T4P/T4SS family [Pseudobdellovibrionaceae bacterium]